MDTRVSFAIQSHPHREHLAALLAGELRAEIVLDPDPDSPIRSPWRTFRHLLETTPPDATHRFQIQDDAIVCPYAREAIEAAVEARPDRLLVFFVAGNPHHHANAVRVACRDDLPWAVLDYAHWVPVVATCWPVDLIPPLLEYVDAQRWPEQFCADDEIVGRYVRELKHRPLASVPSLVEHRDEHQSLIGKRNAGGQDPGRVAACWIGDCADCMDAREIDWTRG